MKSIFLGQDQPTVLGVYAKSQIDEMKEAFGLISDTVYSREMLLSEPQTAVEAEFAFSTWTMPVFTEEEIRRLFPRLRAVFYAAGTVQAFARPFLNCGIEVFSAWAANAVPVAEATVAEIILANKGFFMAARNCSRGLENRERALSYVRATRGNYGARVGIIGVGMIGSLVCKMLGQYKLEVVAFDPFCSEEKAEALGVRLVSLEELFATCDIISNHLANNAETRGMIGKPLFDLMKPCVTFINTGRGAQVVEDDLIEALRARPFFSAVLDVTEPEPPVADSPFYTLDNVLLTPHLAGSLNDELYRMSDYMISEARAFKNGEATSYSVSLKMLETMA